MRAPLTALALLSFAAFPVAAGAGSGPVTSVLKGETTQNLRADVRVGQDGQIIRVAVRYKAICRRSTYRGRIVWEDQDGTENGFNRDADFFSFFDSSTARVKRRRAIVTSTVNGEPANGGGKEGEFRLTLRVQKRGKTIDTCRTGTQRYLAQEVVE